MALIVQKFGGTSVADTNKILAAARKAAREAKKGNQVVMVVSAMGKNTDHLIDLAREITEHPNSREMDMLLSTGEQVTVALMAIALQTLGHEAVSFTAAQIGIHTDNTFNKARIKSISTKRMKEALDSGKIIIAAGFQGIDDDNNITTLGRGGSDTTAVALAAALGADCCDIYTDVDGVYTTDPRIVPEARRVDRISYDEMLELASLGAGVMHSRSIEFAKKFDVLVHVRGSFTDNPGTIIGPDPESEETPVCGAALARDEARITVIGVPDRPGVAMELFSRIAQAKIPTDMIAQNVSTQGKTDISFTVPGDDFDTADAIVRQVVREIGAEGYECNSSVSKVSIVGLGMAHQSGVAQKMFRAIADKGINVHMITTSDIKISVLVPEQDGVAVLRAVHDAFQLGEAPTKKDVRSERPVRSASLDESELVRARFVSRLTGMEDILIEQVALDDSQLRYTMADLPDRPGLAAALFERMASKNVNVDMIVQSVGHHDGLADLSFTVPRQHSESVLPLTRELCSEFDCTCNSNPTVAKLTVCGTGLRSHTGLACRMFKTLADGGINVSIICTSERNISVIVDGKDGQKGHELLLAEFADEMI